MGMGCFINVLSRLGWSRYMLVRILKGSSSVNASSLRRRERALALLRICDSGVPSKWFVILEESRFYSGYPKFIGPFAIICTRALHMSSGSSLPWYFNMNFVACLGCGFFEMVIQDVAVATLRRAGFVPKRGKAREKPHVGPTFQPAYARSNSNRIMIRANSDGNLDRTFSYETLPLRTQFWLQAGLMHGTGCMSVTGIFLAMSTAFSLGISDEPALNLFGAMILWPLQ